MKIKQTNEKNTFGFKKKGDFGVDEFGELALVYQHHDALWWKGTKNREGEITEKEREETLTFFGDMFPSHDP